MDLSALLGDISLTAMQARATAQATGQAITAAFARGLPALGGVDDEAETVSMAGATHRLVSGLPAAARRAEDTALVEALETCAVLADVVYQRVVEGDPQEQASAARLAGLLARLLEDAALQADNAWVRVVRAEQAA